MADSDRLETLPEQPQTQLSPAESTVMTRFFGGEPSKKSGGQVSKMKTILIALIIFIALANPLIGSLMSIIPFMGSSIVSFVVRAILFALLLWGALTFMK